MKWTLIIIGHLIESKRSLLLGISHELRTPLTRAKLALEMADKNKHTERIYEDLNEIEQIVSELLEAEKLSSNQSLARQVSSINELAKQTLKENRDFAYVQFAPIAGDPYVNVDPIRLKLLIKNLLSNACQYSEIAKQESEAEVKLELALNEQQLAIMVKDNGSGMSQEQINKVVEPFYRIDSSRQRKTGGFGLGLYLCKVIAEAHGGQLSIASELGVGTTVTVNIALV